MNMLKRHLSLIVPLLALLFSLQSIVLVNRAISIKEDKLSQSYSILLATTQKIGFDFIAKNIKEAKSLSLINPDFLLDRLKQNMSDTNLLSIKKDLPFFYSLKLSTFPDQNRLEEINRTLLKIPGITKVESFSKTHNQVYRLLFLIKMNVWVFGALLTFLSILLMIRQIQIWRFEHSERMEIMSFLGAPFWIRNGILFQLAIIDSIITSIFITLGAIYLSYQNTFKEIANALEIQGDIFNFGGDFLMLLLVAIGVSFFSVLVVILSQRRV
ncbi:cell division protein FtsX [Helicobacter cappadocius]|uniref:Cell division protein FtsX n=1 Tax=Helicobacter cappadocius TaxID=3063998 RepID=A0AA90Q3A1_9HELI|nr:MULTISPECIES: cell division protein FtsX [unclassified Helicobacter]MDO7253383.1 cell division protein FtsX [Helicobacter sp. faydin-H75]MDP2539353.1 cell division protein FtsX [Helicobacter sp. faydin-H76]